jgi:para-nitrobenzyl esterase
MASAILLATASRAPASKIQQGTLIHLADGDVQGTTNDQTRQFLGIPFAAPPTGALRFRPPTPPAPRQAVLQASAFGNACPQLASIQGPASDTEDCLYLNVWTPDPAPSKPLPVMVWFHGGGNQQGAAGDPIPFPGVSGHFYDAHVLSQERDVVVVTINYRLNVFGFFAHAALASEDTAYPYAGNQGLLDQRFALEWVRANIAAFGGNPKKVTIFGESAGSQDVCLQVASPGTKKLFERAVSESGGCTTRTPTAAEAAVTATTFAAQVGCGGAADQLACLRALPVKTLVDATQGDGGVISSGFSFGPVVDGGFLPDQPRTLYDSGKIAKVPYILGSNSDEGTLFLLGTPPVATEQAYMAALQARYGPLASQIATVYPVASYPTPQDAFARVVGDSILVCSTYDTARRAAAKGAHVYLYNFARRIPIATLQQAGLGAFHGSEIVYVFGSAEASLPPEDDQLGATMRSYWSHFARNGSPNAKGTLKWPRYKDKTDKRLNLDLQSSVLTAFRRPECEFWWGVYDAQFASPSGAFLD